MLGTACRLDEESVEGDTVTDGYDAQGPMTTRQR